MPFVAELPQRLVPRAPGLEHSVAYAADPYRFIGRQCLLANSDVVRCRLLTRPTLCLSGAVAAQLFDDPRRFAREGTAPLLLRSTLAGNCPERTAGAAPRPWREAFLLDATQPTRLAALERQADATWLAMAPRWQGTRQLVLYTAAQEWLTRLVCAWAGVPLPEAEVPLRTAQMAALLDSAASGLGVHLRAWHARHQAERWLAGLIAEIRSGQRHVAGRTVLQMAARMCGEDGASVPARVAAAELLEVLRPMVAVSVFVVFAAHALHHHPGWMAPIAAGSQASTHAFAQEVRRYYPFSAAVAARVREDFVWQGYHFPAGWRALLDVYGTNHDPRLWPQPGEFRPERFFGRVPGLFELVPEGGSRAEDLRRCPGEAVTLALMKQALRLLVQRSRYRVPPQDLSVHMRRLPALPRDRFVIADFRPM